MTEAGGCIHRILLPWVWAEAAVALVIERMDCLLEHRKGFRSQLVAAQTQAAAVVGIQSVGESLSAGVEKLVHSRVVGNLGLAVAEGPVEPLVVDSVLSIRRSQSSLERVACSLSSVPQPAQALTSTLSWAGTNLPTCSMQMEQHGLICLNPSEPGTLFGVDQSQDHSNRLQAIASDLSMRV